MHWKRWHHGKKKNISFVYDYIIYIYISSFAYFVRMFRRCLFVHVHMHLHGIYGSKHMSMFVCIYCQLFNFHDLTCLYISIMEELECYFTLYLFMRCSWRWRSQLMWRVFFTSAVVAVVVRTAMGWCKSGKCGHFGSGGFIIWDISELESITFFCSSILFYCLLPPFLPLLLSWPVSFSVVKRTTRLRNYCRWQLLVLLEVFLVGFFFFLGWSHPNSIHKIYINCY